MNDKSIIEAMVEVKRFIKAVKKLNDADKRELGKPYPSSNPKERGAVRRASLDLTRALASLRRPG